MTTAVAGNLPPTAPPGPAAHRAFTFGPSELRLKPREWLIVLAIVLVWFVLVPRMWKAGEPFPTGPDYRIPYSLSKDYWLYQRRLEQLDDRSVVPVLGDSVVWGEYVRPDGTLSHFLNRQSHGPKSFANCGVNGLFPLAMEGLVEHFGSALRDRKVIVHCNILWMTSPQADLSAASAQPFNHAGLVPQSFGRIPSYRADAATRLSNLLSQHVGYFAWSDHLQTAYYDQRSLPQWTLEDEGNDPPSYPNAWRNPFSPIEAGIPTEPAADPQRGPRSARHKPWNANGAEPADFEWVKLDSSLQWQAFRRTLLLLRSRGNTVLVILGPFNCHMIATDQQPSFQAMNDRIARWLHESQFALVSPRALATELYADASHPLTAGYSCLAAELLDDPVFRRWLDGQKLRMELSRATPSR
jgi:hypothetical protein